ncbi:hypothetical protein BST95_02335 [Halioglobus japonicus]|uniref:class I SAM-dependent methyltransferase n=1 Tax=Halioglobus japonicus TaxID=930805 RepID=UPI00097962A1|nr:class I SAM-dependent methyltransferase [Halioglobus japonicus]AQA17230.1 hypothetical protein BST95_02335 [Halioglobus japonicus]GHD19687.1 hypothetical protein GCM10007052_28480 [Halioglobus japonicus]
MPASKNSSAEHWSQWWSEGHITSFGPALINNYEGATRAHWLQIFAELSEADILDIATGNGALATLAVECAETHGKHFQVTATDIAAIGEHTSSTDSNIPRWRGQISFRAEVPCEQQPFPDASFDLIVSQYGFEYSDIDATLAEVHRLLRPGGRFQAIAHHASSGVIKRQVLSARVYQAALQQLKLFTLLQRHFDSWGKARNPQAVEKLTTKPKFQKSHNALENALRQFVGAFPNDETAARLFCAIDDLRGDASRMSPAARTAALKKQEAGFLGAQARLQDLFGAALDSDRIEHIRSRARDIGYSDATAEPFLDEDGALAGWSLRLLN